MTIVDEAPAVDRRVGERRSHQSLPELELVIRAGILVFLEVAQALLEIQERELYREAGFATLAAYARDRWDIAPSTTYRQVKVAKIMKILSPNEDLGLPANEAQVRELIPFAHDPTALREVWRAVASRGDAKITARAVRECAIQRTGLAPTRRELRRRTETVICPRCRHAWVPA